MEMLIKPLTDDNEISDTLLAQVNSLDEYRESIYKSWITIEPWLSRSMVAFQGNKNRPFYRWYKFKEGFSAGMVEYFLQKYSIVKGTVFDPFAGSGTTLFTAQEMGLNAEGIELLPIGHQIVEARKTLLRNQSEQTVSILQNWKENKPWKSIKAKKLLNELRITRGAYPPATQMEIKRYLSAIDVENENIRGVLIFVLLCVLDDISYTRKDGQFLRWDYRSGRQQSKTTFDKGKIFSFDEAILSKFSEIIDDIEGRQLNSVTPPSDATKKITLYKGSCLSLLPTIEDSSYTAIITSPPYCNRYDYTRTYAKELAILGITDEQLLRLRQDMLSCTVENREKSLVDLNPNWSSVIDYATRHPLLQLILKYLERLKKEKKLNNNGIPRMIRGYFYEMACVIYECSRVLKPGSRMIMVNDNVKYAGVMISVDTILSDFAVNAGFDIENIFVLPNGKGNSSQQMGKFGREPLRKCVYVWRKL